MFARTIFVDDLFVHHNFLFRLRIVLARTLKIKTKEAKEFISRIAQNDSDSDILDKLNELQGKKPIPVLTEKHIGDQIKGVFGNFSKLFTRENVNNKSYDRYLDIGCNDGIVTRGVSQSLNVPSENTYGIDIVDSILETNKKHMHFKIYDGTSIPFKDNLFDIVTVFQVFHHVGVSGSQYNESHLFSLIKDISRVMRNGGILFIKEHDCDSDTMSKLIDIEHILYDMRYNAGRSGMGVGRYRTKENWNNLLKNFGFEFVNSFVDDTCDPTNSVFSIYELKK